MFSLPFAPKMFLFSFLKLLLLVRVCCKILIACKLLSDVNFYWWNFRFHVVTRRSAGIMFYFLLKCSLS